jgi:hypothetical protein
MALRLVSCDHLFRRIEPNTLDGPPPPLLAERRLSSPLFLTLLISNGLLHGWQLSVEPTNGFAFYFLVPSTQGIGALCSLPLLPTMAPKFSLALEFTEQNSSILAADVGQDDLDLHDAWSERATCRWRLSCPDKKAPSVWSSRLTSMSSNLRDAGGVLATRAKQLRVREATHRVILHLRKSMVETSSSERSLARAASMPAQHVFNESDIEPDAEDEDIDDCKSAPSPFMDSRLHIEP